jgi:hypothetical protein
MPNNEKKESTRGKKHCFKKWKMIEWFGSVVLSNRAAKEIVVIAL